MTQQNLSTFFSSRGHTLKHFFDIALLWFLLPTILFLHYPLYIFIYALTGTQKLINVKCITSRAYLKLTSTLGSRINVHVRLFDFDQNSTLYALIRACTLIYFWIFMDFFVKHLGLIWNFFGKK